MLRSVSRDKTTIIIIATTTMFHCICVQYIMVSCEHNTIPCIFIHSCNAAALTATVAVAVDVAITMYEARISKILHE
jgi:hypothetical protein